MGKTEKYPNGLTGELARLAAAIEVGDFGIVLNDDQLPREEAEAIRLLNKALGKYNDSVRYEQIHCGRGEDDEATGEDPRMRILGREITGIDIMKGLEGVGGDIDTYVKILRSYVAGTRTMLDSMETVGPDKLESYGITVHGLKGASRGINANPLGDFAAELESAAKAGDFDFVSERNPAFLEAAWKLVYDLEEIISAIDSENPKPKKDKPDEAVLSMLAAACRSYDISDVDEAMDEIEKYHYLSDGGLAGWLRDNVDLMNFEEIAERLEPLIK